MVVSQSTEKLPPVPARGPASRLSPQRARLLSFAAATAGLVLAMWLYVGYRYEVWPETATLDYVFRFDGQLQGDWHTSLPSVHWFMTHLLGLLPVRAVEPAAFLLWLAYAVILWAAFLLLCEAVGASLPLAFAAGLVAIPTLMSGVGTSDAIMGYFYPVGLSFALGLMGLALLVRRRLYLGFAALGLATLVHPNVGVLLGACAAPVVLLVGERSWRRLVKPFALGALLAAPSLVETAIDQTGGGKLSSQQAFDLMAIVREPHHVLFAAFPTSEYARTAIWLAVAIVGVIVLRRRAEARALGLVVVIVGAFAALGAFAGGNGGPLLLVQAHMPRVTPLVVIAGVLLGAGMLARLGRWWPAAVLTAAALVTQIAATRILEGTPPSWFSPGALAGIAVAVTVAASYALSLLNRRARRVPAAALAFTAMVAAVGVYMVSQKSERVGPESPDVAAYKQIADVTEHASRPGDLVMTPPDQDGFRTFAHRPVIVEFGTFRYGKGDTEWVRRIDDVTQDPKVLDPALGHNAYARIPLIAAAYDRASAASTKAICRYRPAFAVLRAGVPKPAWMDGVAANQYYALYKVDVADFC